MIALLALALASTSPALAGTEDIGRAIEAGRLHQAQAMIARALEEGADSASLERQQADLDFALGKFPSAAARYGRLAATSPNDGALAERLGLALLRAGDETRASAALDKAAAAGGSWRSWNALGVIADRQRRWADAEQAYGRALALAPGRAEVLNNQGWSLLLRGEVERARPLFEAALRAAPGSRLIAANHELALAATAEDLPPRRPGESDQAWAARLNDAGVIAFYRRQPGRARAAFSQAIEASGTYYHRAATNLAALDQGQ